MVLLINLIYLFRILFIWFLISTIYLALILLIIHIWLTMTYIISMKNTWNGWQENFLHSELYEEGKATIPNLAEKLTLELVHHIEVMIALFHYPSGYAVKEIHPGRSKTCRFVFSYLSHDWRSRLRSGWNSGRNGSLWLRASYRTSREDHLSNWCEWHNEITFTNQLTKTR